MTGTHFYQIQNAGQELTCSLQPWLLLLLVGVASTACAFREGLGRTVYSENPVASHLGLVLPRLSEVRTACSEVMMSLLGLLLALFREPHGWRLPIGDLLGSGLGTKVATWWSWP